MLRRLLTTCLAVFLALPAFCALAAPALEPGDSLFKAKKYDEARQAYLALAQGGGDAALAEAALFAAAQCLFEKDGFAAFQVEADALLAGHPQADPYLRTKLKYSLARIPYQQGQWAAAAPALTGFAEQNTKSICAGRALLKAGDALRRQRQFAEARAAFARVAQVKHSPALLLEARHQAAQCLYESADYEGFKQECAALFAEHPPEDDHSVQMSRFLLAHVPGKQGRPDQAAVELDAFIRQYPAFRQRALAEHRCGIFYMIASNQKIFQGKPIDLKVWMECGQAHLAEARRLLAEQIKRDAPAAANNHRFMIAETYYYEHDYTGLYVAAAELAKAYPPPSREWALATYWQGVARAFLSPKDPGEAAALFEAVLKAGVRDDNLDDHVPTQCAAWRAMIAESQHDTATLKAMALLIRDRMPAGAVRTRALARLAGVLK